MKKYRMRRVWPSLRCYASTDVKAEASIQFSSLRIAVKVGDIARSAEFQTTTPRKRRTLALSRIS